MFAAWAGVTDGNLFPLHRSSSFKLTFEELINKRHSAGSCWCSKASVTEQTSLKIPYYFLEGKFL
jgi:hypothetical protein